MVADSNSVFHRCGGNFYGLNNEGHAEKRHDDGDHRGFEVFADNGLWWPGFRLDFRLSPATVWAYRTRSTYPRFFAGGFFGCEGSVDHRILGSRLMCSLKFLLQHCLRIGSRSRNGIYAAQISVEGGLDKFTRRLDAAVQKDRACHCFKHVGEQCALAPATAFFLATAEEDEFAQAQFGRGFGEGWRAHQTMFHARKFTLSRVGMRPKQ